MRENFQVSSHGHRMDTIGPCTAGRLHPQKGKQQRKEKTELKKMTSEQSRMPCLDTFARLVAVLRILVKHR